MVENNYILSWSKEYFLKWSDFQAEVNPAVFEDSFSKITYHHTWTVTSEINNGEVYFLISDIKLETQFLKHLSWVRLLNASSNLLMHEQGHFDLAEFMRPSFEDKIAKQFCEIKFQTHGKNEEQRKQSARDNSNLLILKELEKCLIILDKERQKYDEVTQFGKNFLKQNEYNKNFHKLRI